MGNNLNRECDPTVNCSDLIQAECLDIEDDYIIQSGGAVPIRGIEMVAILLSWFCSTSMAFLDLSCWRLSRTAHDWARVARSPAEKAARSQALALIVWDG